MRSCTSTFSASKRTRRSASAFRCTSRAQAVSPGVKSQGGIVSHMRTEVEISCLPKDLPEFIEVDISGLSLNESIHLSQLKIPDGVHAGRAGEGRRGSGRHPQPACRRAGADGGGGGCAGCGGCGSGSRGGERRRLRPAAMRPRRPSLRRKTKPRRSRQRKTRRSKRLSSFCDQ